MRRGDVVIASERGRLTGKPRPWLVVQSDAFNATHPSVTLCLITSDRTLTGLFRIPVAASKEAGLEADSTVMVDKILSLGSGSIERVIGTMAEEDMRAIDAALRRWLDL